MSEASTSSTQRAPSPTGYLKPRNDESARPKRSGGKKKQNIEKNASSTASSSSEQGQGEGEADDSDVEESDDDDDDRESVTSLDSELEHELAFEESIRQLQLIVNVVALPYICKWAGRKVAFWSWERYVKVGRRLGWDFWWAASW